MEKIKIHNSQRNIKKQNRKETDNYFLTHPKRNYRQYTSRKVFELQRKLGYDYEDTEDSRLMVHLRNEFRDKAAKYYGGHKMGRKMTRFDKMKKKEELGFNLKENPILSHYTRVDKIVERFLLADALFAMKKF